VNIFELLIVQPLFNLLIGLYAVLPGGDFGISIILFTILLRLAMYPLIKKQLHQTKLMRKLQPELEQIKKQTKGNRQMQGILMMELYKRHGVSPFRSIGILLIQLPIFIALYITITVFAWNLDEVSRWTYNFLENLGPIRAIIDNPASFNETFLGFIDLTDHAISSDGINVILIGLAVLAAIGQFIQSKQTMPQASNSKRLRDILKAASNGEEADQSEINTAIMNKMIYFLPFIMLVIMLTLPGAIALYYAATTLVAVIQQHFILKQDEEELEDIASKHSTKTKTPSAVQKRAKNAKEANVTRIVAKGSQPSKPKKQKRSK
jgi:YidC/Oxa1 family membrane protein insertase